LSLVYLGENTCPNKQLKRTKFVVIVFAKTRKKAANKFCPLAGRWYDSPRQVKRTNACRLFSQSFLLF